MPVQIIHVTYRYEWATIESTDMIVLMPCDYSLLAGSPFCGRVLAGVTCARTYGRTRYVAVASAAFACDLRLASGEPTLECAAPKAIRMDRRVSGSVSDWFMARCFGHDFKVEYQYVLNSLQLLFIPSLLLEMSSLHRGGSSFPDVHTKSTNKLPSMRLLWKSRKCLCFKDLTDALELRRFVGGSKILLICSSITSSYHHTVRWYTQKRQYSRTCSCRVQMCGPQNHCMHVLV